jgi:voltage-gated potassium channel Kch
MRNKINLKPEFISAFTALVSLLFLGTVTYHYLEGWSWIESLYFVVVTLTTVGYGDLHPTTDVSRLVTILFILIGVSIAVTSISVIGTRYLAKREERIAKRAEERVSKHE